MRFLALASDYDGTLAAHGKVADETWEAIRRLRASGRKLLLVTGRELSDLQNICPHLEVFDRIVAENGGVVYRPATHTQQILTSAPPRELIQALRQRGVAPLEVGQTLLATVRPFQTQVIQTISRLKLEWQVIFNKDAVMVLPSGVNKATGLKAALNELDLSPRNVVAVGDAENDLEFLQMCACSVAVANALPMLKKHADLITAGEAGQGVVEVIDDLVANDLQRYEKIPH